MKQLYKNLYTQTIIQLNHEISPIPLNQIYKMVQNRIQKDTQKKELFN